MKKKSSGLSLLIILLCFLLFCNKKSDNLIPLKENEVIEYINEAPRTETDLADVKVLSIQEGKDDFTYVNLSSNPFFDMRDKQLFLKVDTKSGKIFSDAGGKEDLLIPEKKNLKKDFSWNYGEWNAVIDSETETVVTEKNTYTNCLKIYYNLSVTMVAEVWIKPKIGIVKFGAYRTNPPSLTRTYYVLKNR